MGRWRRTTRGWEGATEEMPCIPLSGQRKPRKGDEEKDRKTRAIQETEEERYRGEGQEWEDLDHHP